jgi:hypothetical protein
MQTCRCWEKRIVVGIIRVDINPGSFDWRNIVMGAMLECLIADTNVIVDTDGQISIYPTIAALDCGDEAIEECANRSM